MSEQTGLKRFINDLMPKVRVPCCRDEFLSELFRRIDVSLLNEPFDITWARSVLPDGYAENWRWYGYERQIHISPETDRKGNDTGRFLLIVDDEGTEVEMKTRAQFLALCFGLGITLPQKATGDREA